MKIIRITILLFLLQLLFINHSLHAQKWQWSKDAAWHLADAASAQQFRASTTAVDKNGNSYVIADFRNNYPSPTNYCDIDSVKFKSKSGSGICLVSYTCSGAFRWMKVMDGLGPSLARSFDMEVDTFGNLYIAVSAYLKNTLDTFRIDKDTMLTKSIIKIRRLILMKYDSVGKLQWLRLPEMDTITNPTSVYTWCNSISVSPHGEVSMYITSIGLRAYESGKYILPISSEFHSEHVLEYDKDGIFKKGIPLTISNVNPASYPFIRYAKNHKTGIHYAQCVLVDDFYFNPVFGGVPMTQTSLLAQFDSVGNSNWVRQSTSNFIVRNFVVNKPKIDEDGNVFTCFIEEPGKKFHTYNITNSLSTQPLPIVIKCNSSGFVQWGQAMNTTDVYFADLGLSKNKTVCFVACGAGAMSIGSFSKPAGQFRLVSAILNSETGAVKSFDSTANSISISVSSISSDLKGNFYLTGLFMDSLHFCAPGMPYSIRSNVGAAMYFVKFGDPSCEADKLSITESNIKIQSIYPNPFSDFLMFNDIENGSYIVIHNILGEVEMSMIAQQSQLRISTSNLTFGAHLVSVIKINGDRVSKVLIKE